MGRAGGRAEEAVTTEYIAQLLRELDQEKAKNAGLNLAADQYSESRDQWMLKAKTAEADLAEYRKALDITMAENEQRVAAGRALRAELEAARRIIAAAREVMVQGTIGGYTRLVLSDAIAAYDAALKEPS